MPPGPVRLVALELVDVEPVATLIPVGWDRSGHIRHIAYNLKLHFSFYLWPMRSVSMSHLPTRICSVDGMSSACMSSLGKSIVLNPKPGSNGRVP